MSATSTTALLLERVARDPSAPLCAIPDSFGGWFELSGAEFVDRVRALAKGLLQAELGLGDRIGVLSSTRFEATLVDFAAGMVGVAVVPLSRDASQEHLLAVLDDAGVRAVVVETARDFARFDELHGDLPTVDGVWQIALNGLDKLALTGRGSVSDDELEARIALVTADTALADHYFADADGLLRRVTVEHGIAVGRAEALAEILAGGAGGAERRSTLLVLPTVDVISRITTLVAVAIGARIGHLSDPSALLSTLAAFRPTLLVAHPDVFEEIDWVARERAQAAGRGAALRQALDVARDYADALDGGSVPRGLRTRFALADALVLRGFRKAAGGRLVDVVSIATQTSLPTGLRQLMRALDARPVEAYGTIESTGIAVIERRDDPFARPFGSVGAPLPGVTASIGADGELVLGGSGIAEAVLVSGGAAGAGHARAARGAGAVFATGLSADIGDDGRVVLLDREADLMPADVPAPDAAAVDAAPAHDSPAS